MAIGRDHDESSALCDQQRTHAPKEDRLSCKKSLSCRSMNFLIESIAAPPESLS